MSRKKTEIYQTFLASLKGGGVYPQFGKTPNYFRFFLVKASLRKAYIPNLRPLGPLLHVEKFMVGGWWVVVVVCKAILVITLGP